MGLKNLDSRLRGNDGARLRGMMEPASAGRTEKTWIRELVKD